MQENSRYIRMKQPKKDIDVKENNKKAKELYKKLINGESHKKPDGGDGP